MRSPQYATAGKFHLLLAAALIIGIVLGVAQSRATEAQQNLLLDVSINNVPVNMISSFSLLADRRMMSTVGELRELGIQMDSQRAPTDVIVLDDIPTLKYTYDEKAQKISITIDDAYRERRKIDLRETKAHRVRSQAGWGTILNYDLFNTTSSVRDLSVSSFVGSSLTFEARAFSPYGTLGQSGIVRSMPDQSVEGIRLDTSFRTSDEERLITYGAGDAINGGLAWTRPIRIGGLQVQRNYSLRPDLITMPLPSVGGTAAVPSTVDVFVNNIKTYSQNVAAGPFSINNIPLITGAGNTEIVVTDSSGHQTKTTTPFYASASLLAPELMSWSFEGGLPRLFYGSTSDTYVDTPVGSATLRRGIYDWLTVEGHAEAGAGVANGGVGAVIKTGTRGLAGVAISGSTNNGNQGMQAYLSYETALSRLNISASSQRTFWNYDDLASATSRMQSAIALGPQGLSSLFNFTQSNFTPPYSSIYSPFYANARPPAAIDRITLSAPLAFDLKASLSTTFLHTADALGNVSYITSATYTRQLPLNASMFATVFRDFGTSKNTGIFIGLSVPLGGNASVSTGISSGNGGTTGYVEALKPLDQKPGSYGWDVKESEGASKYRSASASYRSNYGAVQAGVSQIQTSSSGSVELRGSIASMGGGVFFSNWIDDSFAVVDVGTPGIEVLNENRSMGVTGANGMMLLPSLRSYQNNKIAINPNNLPVDAEMESTHTVTAPADRAGVLVKFKVRSDTTSALVTFLRPNGKVVPAGATGRIDGGSEFIVGYDGQAFIKDLTAKNEAVIDLGSGSCRASFEFSPRPGEQVQIPQVACR